jgi:hypothetical protein
LKERLLVLAKAAPVVSSKYRYLVCVAKLLKTKTLDSFFK